MKQVTKLLSLLMALSLLLALTACGGAGPASSAPVASAEASAAEPAEEAPEAPAEEAEAPETTEASYAEETGSEEETADASEEPEEPEIVIEYPLFDTPQTYTIWFSNSPDLSDIINSMDEYLVFRELEKVTNVTWDPTMVSFFSSGEQFSLMVASEDYTDVVVRAVDSYSGSVDQAIEEEFLIDLSDLIDENMPNLTKWFNTYPILRKQVTSDEGNIAGFPKIYKEPSDVTEGAMIRQDWLDDLGLENPKTYDDLQTVLEAFRDQKGATAPLVIPSSTGVQGDFLNGYNIGNSYQVDGEVRYGMLQPEFKEYLTMMHNWYEDGLLSDSFLSSQAEVLIDMSTVLNGQTGVWSGAGAQSIANIHAMTEDTDMRINGLTNVTKDGSVAHVGTESTLLDSIMWSITTECEDPDVICKYIDYIYGDDGVLLANYGVEGETFVYENGEPVFTDIVTNNPDYTYSLALNIYTCDRQTPVPFVIDEDKVRMNYSDEQKSAVEIWSAASDGLYNIPRQGVNMTADETSEYNRIYSDIETYTDENIAKFIVGDKSLDEFDSFVDTLYQMGIEDCLAISQAAYDRFVAE